MLRFVDSATLRGKAREWLHLVAPSCVPLRPETWSEFCGIVKDRIGDGREVLVTITMAKQLLEGEETASAGMIGKFQEMLLCTAIVEDHERIQHVCVLGESVGSTRGSQDASLRKGAAIAHWLFAASLMEQAQKEIPEAQVAVMGTGRWLTPRLAQDLLREAAEVGIDPQQVKAKLQHILAGSREAKG